MRKLLQLYFGLLVPLSMLFIVASIVYFKLDYDLTKAMRLGVLSGFFIGAIVSLFTAIFLLIMRRGKQPKENIIKSPKRRHQTEAKVTEKKVTTNKHTLSKATSITSSIATKNLVDTHIQKVMLLMEHELAFEVAVYAISEEKIGTITDTDASKGLLDITTKDEHIKLSILSLTRHTTQVLIETNPNSEYTKKIIKYLKGKELSFLQY